MRRATTRGSALPALLLAGGLAFFGKGTWIYGKARLAQALLHRAWARTLAGETHVKPWPWADTWPIARLRIPSAGADFIVLAGASGRTLAFGPGHLDGSAPPGSPGNCVLSAHRDTQFEALEKLTRGDTIEIETPDGLRHLYRVEDLSVVDRRNTAALRPESEAALTLVTCYPFHAVAPGGPLRYVVRAREADQRRESAASKSRSVFRVSHSGSRAAPAVAASIEVSSGSAGGPLPTPKYL